MKKNRLPYYLAILFAYIIWAAATPIIILTLGYIPPLTFLLLRFLIVCILVLPYTIVLLRNNKVHHQDYLKIIVLGIFTVSSLAILFIGLEYTSAIEATILGLLGTVMSVAAGHYFYNEKTGWRIKVGVIIATLGTLFIALLPLIEGHNDMAGRQKIYGNFLLLIYNLFFVMFLIWSKISMGQKTIQTNKFLNIIHVKPFKKIYSPMLLMTLSFYVGLATFIPLAILESKGFFGPYNFVLTDLSLKPMLGLLYMVLLSTIVAYYLFEWSLTGAELKDTAIFSYLSPLMTLPFAFLLLREIPSKDVILGSLIIALGVIIAESKKS